jgi:hypothetical protein
LNKGLSASRNSPPRSGIFLSMSLTLSARRWLASAFAFCSFATLTLLANHPAAGGHTIVDLIKTEASNQFSDALVHGGFILTLSALIVCFVFLSRGLGTEGVSVVIGLVTFSVGCGALVAAMMLDGFVIPALAQRFTGTSNGDTLIQASTLFIFSGTLIRLLMPMGLWFQAAAMLSWSFQIVGHRGWRLAVGAFGMAAGTLVMGAICVALPRLGDHVLIGGIVLISVWYLALAGALCARNGWPSPSTG